MDKDAVIQRLWNALDGLVGGGTGPFDKRWDEAKAALVFCYPYADKPVDDGDIPF